MLIVIVPVLTMPHSLEMKFAEHGPISKMRHFYFARIGHYYFAVTITGIAGYVMSARLSAMQATITRFWLHDLYINARSLNPARWSGNTRNWAAVGAVTLNPERDSIIKTHLARNDFQPLAA